MESTSPMLSHLNQVIIAAADSSNRDLLKETMNKVRAFILNEQSCGRDHQTPAIKAIEAYICASIGNDHDKNHHVSRERLVERISTFLTKMADFHARNSEPPPNYWSLFVSSNTLLCKNFYPITETQDKVAEKSAFSMFLQLFVSS